MSTPPDPVSRVAAVLLSKAESCTTPGAAKGDDDLMSIPCPAPEAASGRWQERIAAARLNWWQLSLDELAQVDGHEFRLARLLRERCSFSDRLADRQARDFFAKHMA